MAHLDPQVLLNLEAAMARLLIPDTETVQTAGKFIQTYMQDPLSAGGLLELMQRSTQHVVRQMAALFLRRKINTYWLRLSNEQQVAIKQILLARMSEEPERLVRHAIVSVIAALCKHQLSNNQWPEFWEFVAFCVKHESAVFREMGMLLLLAILETTGATLSEQYPAMQSAFQVALTDATQEVRLMGLRAACKLMSIVWADEQVLSFKNQISLLLNVTREAVRSGADEACADAFDGFADICESTVPLVNDAVGALLTFFYEVLADATLETGLRDQASHCISNLCTSRPKAVSKSGILPKILDTCLGLLTEYDAEEDAEVAASSDTSVTACAIGESLLDSIATSISSKFVFPPVTERVAPLLASATWEHRRAAVAGLAIIAEGCREPMLLVMDDILPIVCRLCGDEHPWVREGACWALGQFAEYIAQFTARYDDVLPVVLPLLSESNDLVLEKAVYVLESMCENLPKPGVDKYLATIMTAIGPLMSHPNVTIRGRGPSVIASLAIAAKRQLEPYFPAISKVLLEMMELSADEDLKLRAAATEAMGHLACNIGPEAFEPVVERAITAANIGLNLGDYAVSEFSTMFFGNLCEVFGDAFSEPIEGLIPVLIDFLSSSDGYVQVKGGGGIADAVDQVALDDKEPRAATGRHVHDADDDDDDEHGYKEEEDDDDDEDDDDEDEGLGDEEDAPQVGQHVTLRVHIPAVDLKSAAACTLGTIAENCPTAMFKHVKPVFDVLEDRIQFFHPGVRQNCVTALTQLVSMMFEVQPPVPPSAERPMTELQPASKHLLNSCMMMFLRQMQTDNDREVVARCCEGIACWLGLIGVAAVYDYAEPLMKMVMKLVKEQSVCQQYEPDQEEDADEDADHDAVLIGAVADLVVALAKATGPAFVPSLTAMAPHLLKFGRPSRPASDKAMCCGLFADLALELGETLAPWVPQVGPIICAGLVDKRADLVRQNACFASGTVFSVGGAAAHPFLQDTVRTLLDIQSSSPIANTRDNATSALAQLINAHADILPVGVLVDAIFAHLPLTGDVLENPRVYRSLCGLLLKGHADISSRLPVLLTHLAHAVSEDTVVRDQVTEIIAKGLREAFTAQGQVLMAAVNTLPAEVKATLIAACK